jgi:hypothetical protein
MYRLLQRLFDCEIALKLQRVKLYVSIVSNYGSLSFTLSLAGINGS